MKTREELLKELDESETIASKSSFLDDWNTQRKIGIDGVKDILQAPTQEQLDCPYCHNDPKQADLLKKYTDDNMYIVYLKSNTLNLEAAGLRVSEKVKFCPVCGRKLGDE